MSSGISTEVRSDRRRRRAAAKEAAAERSSRPRVTGSVAADVATDAGSGLRPWQFFFLGGLLAATVGVFLSRGADPASVMLLGAAIGAASVAAFALFRTLAPLVASDFGEDTEMLAGRTRVALEREKLLVLRSIKELEFDRAMGKISEADFREMGGRLRARAGRLIRQLDENGGYHELIERDLAARLPRSPVPPIRPAASAAPEPPAEIAGHVCPACGTGNDVDARFCKSCGAKL